MAEKMVTVQLTGPLSAAQAAALRAKDVKDYERPGMEIVVPVDGARALINAGYVVGVEQSDSAAVEDLLNPKTAVKTSKTDSGKTETKG